MAQLPLFDDGRVVSGRRGDLPAGRHVLQARSRRGLVYRRAAAQREEHDDDAHVSLRGACAVTRTFACRCRRRGESHEPSGD